jgi:hypothetical protein
MADKDMDLTPCLSPSMLPGAPRPGTADLPQSEFSPVPNPLSIDQDNTIGDLIPSSFHEQNRVSGIFIRRVMEILVKYTMMEQRTYTSPIVVSFW